MSPSTCLIRADANARMGAGHVMRTLALAQELLQQGIQPTFAMADGLDAMALRLTNEGMTLHPIASDPGSPEDARETSDRATALGAEWIIVDGYHFSPAYHASLRQGGHRVLAVDDTGHLDRYDVEIVLNQNLHARPELYPNRLDDTRLLLGSEYVLLRQEFLERGAVDRTIPAHAKNVLITLGGGDFQNLTLTAMRAVQMTGLEDLHVRVLLGGTNPHLSELRIMADRSSVAMEIMRHVSDMPAVMAWADLAISAAGSTCWEMAYLGLPAIVMVVAENQRGVASELHAREAVHSLGWWEDVTELKLAPAIQALIADSDRRETMSHAGRVLIDGGGAKRVADAMTEVSHAARSHR